MLARLFLPLIVKQMCNIGLVSDGRSSLSRHGLADELPMNAASLLCIFDNCGKTQLPYSKQISNSLLANTVNGVHPNAQASILATQTVRSFFVSHIFLALHRSRLTSSIDKSELAPYWLQIPSSWNISPSKSSVARDGQTSWYRLSCSG